MKTEPEGIKMKLGVGLKGQVIWTLEREGEIVEGGHLQDNLITNGGLNNYGLMGMAYRNKAQVGTGNSTPSFSNTSLDTPSLSTTVVETSVVTAVKNSTNGYIEVTYTTTFKFDIVAAINATEFGFSPNNGTDPISIRQLFRDVSNNPTTISALPNDRLLLTHIQKLFLSPFDSSSTQTMVIREVNRSDVLIQEISLAGKSTWAIAGAGGADTNPLNLLTNPSASLTGGYGFQNTYNNQSGTVSAANSGHTTLPSGIFNPVMSVDPYVADSHLTVRRMSWGADEAVGTHYGWKIAHGSSSFSIGFKMMLDVDVTFVKDNLHTLEIEIETTWGRL